MIADRGPVRAAYDANVLDGKNSEEKVLIGPIVPILIHFVQQRVLLLRISIVERGQERDQEPREIRYGIDQDSASNLWTGGPSGSSGGLLVRVRFAVPGSLE